MSIISVNQWSSTNYLSFLWDVNHQREPTIFNQLSFFHIIWYFYFFLVGCQPLAWTNDLQPTIFLSYYLVFQFVGCQPSVWTNDLQPTIFLSCQMSTISANQWSSTNYLSFILSGISYSCSYFLNFLCFLVFHILVLIFLIFLQFLVYLPTHAWKHVSLTSYLT